MALRLEWRSKAEGEDVLLAVDEGSNTVKEEWEADTDLLTDFLNEMAGLDTGTRGKVPSGDRDPQEWGDLVIARSESGDVLSVDPELYWEGIAYWFRSRGRDPHLWRGRK